MQKTKRKNICRAGFICLAASLNWISPAWGESPYAPLAPRPSAINASSESPTVDAQPELTDFETDLTNQVAASHGLQAAAPPPRATPHTTTLTLGICLGLGLLVPLLRRGFLEIRNATTVAAPSPSVSRRSTSLTYSDGAGSREAHEAFEEFASNFRLSLRKTTHATGSPQSSLQERQDNRKADCNESSSASGVISSPLKPFLSETSDISAALRTLYAELQQSSGAEAIQSVVGKMSEQVHALKDSAGIPELCCCWQMAAATEGLLTQLRGKPGNLNPSTLRTLSGALEILDQLARSAVRADLLSTPEVRILAVDDDAIGRHAITFALKKAFPAVDIMATPVEALAIAAKQPYDVMFLDLQMPGMDGFELCSKIHETTENRNTPAVFVTAHRDFKTRAQATLSGAEDMLGKPFLTFEIAVKAITIVARERLQQLGASPSETSDKFEATAEAPPSEVAKSRTPENPLQRKISPEGASTPPSETFGYITSRLRELRGQLLTLKQAADGAIEDKAGDLFLSLRAFTALLEHKEMRTAGRVSSALEGLARKFIEKPQTINSSTLNTAAASFDLLEDLCALSGNLDLENPPLRFLVVDDEPIARRATSGALQLLFGKPETAEDGAAAVEAAAANAVDVIFMDVVMPGIDGFEACSRIRKEGASREASIIFVSGHADDSSREKAFEAGGNGFIVKPVLPAEVSLQALTYAFRARLAKRLACKAA